jgi:hypothetical protein
MKTKAEQSLIRTSGLSNKTTEYHYVGTWRFVSQLLNNSSSKTPFQTVLSLSSQLNLSELRNDAPSTSSWVVMKSRRERSSEDSDYSASKELADSGYLSTTSRRGQKSSESTNLPIISECEVPLRPETPGILIPTKNSVV